MKKTVVLALAAVVVLAAGVAVYLYRFQESTKPQQAPVEIAVPPELPAESPPVPRQVLEEPPEREALPSLTESDQVILDALAGLMGSERVMKLFYGTRLINKFVAVVDNLPRKKLPVAVMPVRRAAGAFIVEGSQDAWIISPPNAARYSGYVAFAEAVDASKLADIYVRFYPLLQQAYEEMGYPGKYFNDRLLVAIDDLLSAPLAPKPVRLVRPGVFYLYADPNLEARSSGQKILMRIGVADAVKIKKKLDEIKKQIQRRMRDKKAAD